MQIDRQALPEKVEHQLRVVHSLSALAEAVSVVARFYQSHGVHHHFASVTVKVMLVNHLLYEAMHFGVGEAKRVSTAGLKVRFLNTLKIDHAEMGAG